MGLSQNTHTYIGAIYMKNSEIELKSITKISNTETQQAKEFKSTAN